MKLLFDQNLSPQLVKDLSDLFAGAQHVRALGMKEAPDIDIWRYARENDLIIVSKDLGFGEPRREPFPPVKVILIRRGNCSTRAVVEMLRRNAIRVKELADNAEKQLLELF